jgi:hypothetical protein
MANEKQAPGRAHAQEQEPVFLIGALLVKELNGEVVEEHGLCRFERDSVLAFIGNRFGWIPLEAHGEYIVFQQRHGSRQGQASTLEIDKKCGPESAISRRMSDRPNRSIEKIIAALPKAAFSGFFLGANAGKTLAIEISHEPPSSGDHDAQKI